jgi:hypothetical protein
MKKFPITLLCCLTWMSTNALAADARLCNLQGREIALRISEEVSEELSASGRNRIATIAEEVCLDYSEDNAAPATQGLPLVSRPASAQGVVPATAASVPAPESASETTGEGEDEDGLFNLRIIDPEDRVRRPGLKRR